VLDRDNDPTNPPFPQAVLHHCGWPDADGVQVPVAAVTDRKYTNVASAKSTAFWKQLKEQTVSSLSVDNLPKSIELPALPHAVMEFVEKSADPDFDVNVLAAIVEKDTALTVELLRFVNSASFTLRSNAECVKDAIMQIGVTNAKNHLLAAGLKAATRAMNSKLINQRNFWNESLQRALFAREVARRMKLDAGLAFLGGLLQDYLLPVLTNHFDGEYIKFLSNDAADGRSLVDWEQEHFGWDHAQAGACLAAQWYFPDDILCAMWHHHALQEVLQGAGEEFFKLFPIALAGMLPDQLKQHSNGLAEIIRVDDQCKALHVDEVCTIVDEQQMEMADGYDIPNYLANLLQEARSMSGQFATVSPQQVPRVV
jgi:HD-like signal output (HDOD) protein